MRISLINGSPKPGKSASGSILTALGERLRGQSIVEYSSAKQDALASFINGYDAVVFAFPLYVDGIPSHLLRQLDGTITDADIDSDETMVYTMINNGFYDGWQNTTALEMMKNWVSRAGLKWGKGLGIGAGGMIDASPIGRGPMKRLGEQLDILSDDIVNRRYADDHTFQPNFSRSLYKAAAHYGWNSQAKKNGVSKKDIKSTPYI